MLLFVLAAVAVAAAVAALALKVLERRMKFERRRLDADGETSADAAKGMQQSTASAPDAETKNGPPRSAAATAEGAPQDQSDAACWICLEGGIDQPGRPLFRTCSCRGASGFVHLSCRVEYAKSKSSRFSAPREFSNSWDKCPSCLLHYGGEFRILLADECIQFLEQEGADIDWRNLKAYILKGASLFYAQSKEAEKAAKKCLLLAETLKGTPEYSVGLPRRVVNEEEAQAFAMLGGLASNKRTAEGDQEALQNFEKACRLYRELGNEAIVAGFEAQIAQIKSRRGKGHADCMCANCAEGRLVLHRRAYDLSVPEWGEESTTSLEVGVRLAKCLATAHRGVESERLFRKILSINKRVLGPHHEWTREIKEEVSNAANRIVFLNDRTHYEAFKAMRYESDGDRCMVRGPLRLLPSGEVNDGPTFTVDSKKIVPMPGTPVVCHGLKKAIAMNGKIGDVRGGVDDILSAMHANGRVEIHFEDKSVEPKRIRPANLRVLFELPEVDE